MIEDSSPIAFILGNYLTSGLGISRSLGREKIQVIWLNSKGIQIGFQSRYCKGINCPNPSKNEKEYIDFLINIGKKEYAIFSKDDPLPYIVLYSKLILNQYRH